MHPRHLPLMTRGHYQRELLAWLFLPFMMGAIEGGVVSVMVINGFTGRVPDHILHMTVAVLTGAPAFANCTSFLWIRLMHGRRKTPILTGLLLACALCVGLIGLAPRTGEGLVLLVSGIVGARIAWAGVITLRATIWRMNYPRSSRARISGRLSILNLALVSCTGLVLGMALQADATAYRVFFPLAALAGLAGAGLYHRIRVRGELRLLRREQDERAAGTAILSPGQFITMFREDPLYRGYLFAMFIFGTGNLMVSPVLVILLHDRFGYGYLAGITIVAVLPLAMAALVLPLWSRLLDRVHIIPYRCRHVWSFAASTLCLLAACLAMSPTLLWTSAVIRGIGIGGGVLGWNLGHMDFSPPERTGSYMGVHVALTGVRGLIAPSIGIALYEWINNVWPGHGAWTIAACLALILVGCMLFLRLDSLRGGTGGVTGRDRETAASLP